MPQLQQCAVEQVSSAPQHRPTIRVDFDADLQWYIDCGESALGARGTLGSVVQQIERGSVGGARLDASGAPEHPYTGLQLGFGREGAFRIGDVERHRWLSTAWHAISERSRALLLSRYLPAPAALSVAGKTVDVRSDGGYGAKDKFVEDTKPYGDPPVREFGHRGRQIKVKAYERRLRRWEAERDRVERAARTTGIESRLGVYAGLALLFCENPGALLTACHEPDPQQRRRGKTVINRALQAKRGGIIKRALETAQKANIEAHAEWLESKHGADPARTNLKRGRRSA